MMIRMFEYDSQIALDGGEMVRGRLIVTFPHSAVLYLRHNRNTPDVLTVEIKTPGGNISYEEQFEEYEADAGKLQGLRREYAGIVERLEKLCAEGNISEYMKCTLMDMSKRVIENIAARYAKVKKGVTSIMGGKVLEYEAKTILQDGIREGKLAGMREGKLVGMREGKIEGYVEMVRDGLLSLPEAAARLGMDEEELKKYL